MDWLFDAHVHLFSSDVLGDRERYLDDKAFSLLYSDSKSRLADAHVLRNYLEETKTEGCFAYGFCWYDTHRCLEHNDYLLSQSGKGIYPFASVPPVPTKDVEKVFRQIEENDFFGIGELSFYCEEMEDSIFAYLADVYSLAREKGLILTLHVNEPVGHKYPGKYITPFDKLYELLQEFHEVKTILAHWGGGLFVYEMMPEVKKKLNSIYYDTAASPYLYNASVWKNGVSIVGDDKILFGTDFPLLRSERYFTEIESCGINESQKNKILGLNAKNLLKN